MPGTSRSVRWTAGAFALGLLVVMIVPPAALAAGKLRVSYSLPPGWTARDGIGKAGGFGSIYLTGKLAERDTVQTLGGGVVVTYQKERPYATLDDFLKAWAFRASDQGPSYAWAENEKSGTTELKGRSAWYVSRDRHASLSPKGQGAGPAQSFRERVYYVDLGDSSVLVTAESNAGHADVGRLEEADAQVVQVLDGLRIAFPGKGTTPGPDDSGGGWRTVFGGLGAVAAAAVAMAGAFARSRRRDTTAPDAPVGYILQVSERSIAPRADRATPLSASAWLVRASGAYEPAADVVLEVSAPAGVASQPAAGTARLDAQVWATGAIAVRSQLTVTARGPAGGTSAAVAVAAPAALHAEPDTIEIALGSGQERELDVWVDGVGAQQWEFAHAWDDAVAEPASVMLKRLRPEHVRLRLKESGADAPDDGRRNVVRKLLITATTAAGDKLEREVTCVLPREGLFADTVGAHPDGTFRIDATGTGKPKDIDFRIVMRDASGALRSDPGRLAELRFEPVAEPGTAERNLFEFGKLDASFAGVTPGADAYGTWRLGVGRAIPGDGNAIAVRMLATVPGLDPETYRCAFTLGYQPLAVDPAAQQIEIERRRAQTTIDTFAPPKLRAELQKLLDTQGPKLGPEGMAELRRRIWRTARDAVTAERDGYLAEAAWNDRIVYILDWASYVGDFAFGAVASTALGPWGGMGANILKQYLVSAIQAYQEGKSAEQWAEEQIWAFAYIFEGRVVDVDTWAKLTGASRIKVWAAFCCYHFCKSLHGQKDVSIVQAAKDTAWAVNDALISTWLGEKARASWARRGCGGTPKVAPPPDAENLTQHVEPETKPRRPSEDRARPVAEGAPRPKAMELDDTGRRILQGARTGADGELVASTADVVEIMTDPQKVRAIKEGPADVRAAFDNARKRMYEAHDLDVERYVKDRVPGMADRDVRVIEFRTPGKDGAASMNTDRDFRVCFKDVDAATGAERWVEVDRRYWEKQSHRAFAEATGGPADAEGAKAWAEGHQQLGTDKYHPEASPDFSDQALVVNKETGRVERTQVVPNIVLVKQGQGRLLDPDAMGTMYRQKVYDAMRGGEPTTEAFVQARKGVAELDEVRGGYGAKHEIGELPPKLREGMRIVREAGERQSDPSFGPEADARLRDAGFEGGLPDFMNKLSGQWGALKTAKPK